MRELSVICNKKVAGKIEETTDGFVFTYDETYMNGNNEPVSLALPMTQQHYFCSTLFPCFINLLPEGANRKMICRKLHLDENDCFGLLIALADKDFIGNLSFEK